MALQNLIKLDSVVQFPEDILCEQPDAKWLCHIGVHNSANRNSGDTLLFPVVRKVFDQVLGPFNWRLRQAWKDFDLPDAIEVNSSCDGIVIGGGGLLLKDQKGCETSNSGWQWNSSVEAVENLTIPLFIFAIGYNRFPGQPDFDPIFKTHINALAKKSTFFGLRNTGSIKALNQYLSDDLNLKLKRQYCPTTVLWQLYPDYVVRAKEHDSQNRKVFVINVAFDRSSFRFGDRESELLSRLANAVLIAQERDWQIVVVAHKTMDRDIEPYLDSANVIYDTVDLTDASPEQIIDFYASVDFVFGMRGHAQMIPFGLRRPIMSIISHDKMRFFLEDINHPEWGVEIDDPNLLNKLEVFLSDLEVGERRDSIHQQIARAQETVWQETQVNFESIRKLMLASAK